MAAAVITVAVGGREIVEDCPLRLGRQGMQGLAHPGGMSMMLSSHTHAAPKDLVTPWTEIPMPTCETSPTNPAPIAVDRARTGIAA